MSDLVPPFHYSYAEAEDELYDLFERDRHAHMDYDEGEATADQQETAPRSKPRPRPFTYRLRDIGAGASLGEAERLVVCVANDTQLIPGLADAEATRTWDYAGIIFIPVPSTVMRKLGARVATTSVYSVDLYEGVDASASKLFVNKEDPSTVLVTVSPDVPLPMLSMWSRVLFSIVTPKRVLVVDQASKVHVPVNDVRTLFVSGATAAVLNYCDTRGIAAKYKHVKRDDSDILSVDIDAAFAGEDSSLSPDLDITDHMRTGNPAVYI